MSADAVLVVADTLREHQWRGNFLGCGCGWNWPEELTHFCGEDERIAKAHASHVAAAVVDALGGLEREEQWTPIQADGDRWQPRDKALALAALDLYGINGPAHFPDTSPVASIEHESRWVSGWVREPAEETP